MKNKLLQSLIVGASLAVMTVGVVAVMTPAPAEARDDRHKHRDHKAREHARERAIERRNEWRRDHRRWDSHQRRYVYYPPPVVYEPAPPSGLNFIFRLD